MNHLERHNILSDHQHGFRKGRSCATQLIQAVDDDDLANCLNEGGHIDAVLLDISKAFDKVPHHHLATKTPSLRYAREDVGMGEKLSEQSHTGSDPGRGKGFTGPNDLRRPTGICTCPILFLCCINHLPNQVSSTARLFADDCLVNQHNK